MATTTHIFRFLTGLESFASTPGGTGCNMQYWPLHKIHGLRFSHLGNVGGGTVGKLATVSRSIVTCRYHNGTAGDSHWEWSGTWEDLGVTPGNIISAVQGDYIYRWYMRHSGRGTSMSPQEFAAGACKSGPFELRDNGGSVIGTFSTAQDAPARGAGFGAALWRDLPVSASNLIDDTVMPGWAWVYGTNLTGLTQASNTSIKLRLRNYLPATDNVPGSFIRLKQGRVALTITSAAPASNNNFLFNYF